MLAEDWFKLYKNGWVKMKCEEKVGNIADKLQYQRYAKYRQCDKYCIGSWNYAETYVKKL